MRKWRGSAEGKVAPHQAGLSIDTRGLQRTPINQRPIGGGRWARNNEFVVRYTNDSEARTIRGPEPEE